MLPLEEASAKVGSIGKLLPSLKARIVDANGRDAPQGEAGEMVLKGPTVMKCVGRANRGRHRAEAVDLGATGATTRRLGRRLHPTAGIGRGTWLGWTRMGIGSESRCQSRSQISASLCSIVDRLKELIKYKGFQGEPEHIVGNRALDALQCPPPSSNRCFNLTQKSPTPGSSACTRRRRRRSCRGHTWRSGEG